MSKHYTKEEKLQMLKQVENLGCTTAAKVLNVNKTTVVRWRN